MTETGSVAVVADDDASTLAEPKDGEMGTELFRGWP